MTTSTQTSLTLEQFLALPERASDGSHYELSEGELITLSAAGYRHGLIVINTAHVLRSTLDRTKFLVVGGETGFLLDPTNESATVRGADLAVTRRDDLHGSIPIGLFPGAPLLAVEVVSPTNTAEDMDRKIRQYLAAGSQEVWIVYPETRRVYAYSAKEHNPVILNEEDELASDSLNIHVAVMSFFEF